MKYQEFDIPKYDWKVYAFYDTTADDIDDIMMCSYTTSVVRQALPSKHTRMYRKIKRIQV